MTDEELIAKIGLELQNPNIELSPKERRARKFLMERSRMLRGKHGQLHSYLVELVKPKKRSVIDFSCGSGIWLEIVRAYGHEIMGLDLQYFPYLESQGIPYIDHDCRHWPYPVPDQSYDYLTCQGAITFYGSVPWSDILSEFMRIARSCVFVSANSGPVLEANRSIIENWCPKGWKRTLNGPSNFKWVRK